MNKRKPTTLYSSLKVKTHFYNKDTKKNYLQTGSTSLRRRRSKSDLISATDVLQVLLDGQKLPLSQAYQVWKLRRHWKDIVGETINEHSRPLFYIRGTLYIWSENSVWTQEFVFLSQTIKQKINDYMGKNWVRNLRFQLQEEVY